MKEGKNREESKQKKFYIYRDEEIFEKYQSGSYRTQRAAIAAAHDEESAKALCSRLNKMGYYEDRNVQYCTQEEMDRYEEYDQYIKDTRESAEYGRWSKEREEHNPIVSKVLKEKNASREEKSAAADTDPICRNAACILKPVRHFCPARLSLRLPGHTIYGTGRLKYYTTYRQ